MSHFTVNSVQRNIPGHILPIGRAFSPLSLHYFCWMFHSVLSSQHYQIQLYEAPDSFLDDGNLDMGLGKSFSFLISDSSLWRCRLWNQMLPIIPSSLMMSSVRVSTLKIHSFMNFDVRGCKYQRMVCSISRIPWI